MNDRLYLLSNLILAIILFISALMQIAILYGLGVVFRRVSSEHSVLITEEGPNLHEVFPPFQLVTDESKQIDNAIFRMNETIFLFLSADCSPCETVLRAIKRLPQNYGDPLQFVLILSSGFTNHDAIIAKIPYNVHVISNDNGSLKNRFNVLRTPFGIFIDKSGVVRMKGILSHYDHLEALVMRRGRALNNAFWEDRNTP